MEPGVTTLPGTQEQTFLLSALPGYQQRYDFPRFERDLNRTMCEVRDIPTILTELAMRIWRGHANGGLSFGRALEQAEQAPPGQCTVCMDAQSSYLLDPCGHMAACETCAESLQRCPLCMEDITRRIRFYFP